MKIGSNYSVLRNIFTWNLLQTRVHLTMQQKVLTAVLHSWIVLLWGYSNARAHDGSTVSRMLAGKTQGHCLEEKHCEEHEVTSSPVDLAVCFSTVVIYSM